MTMTEWIWRLRICLWSWSAAGGSNRGNTCSCCIISQCFQWLKMTFGWGLSDGSSISISISVPPIGGIPKVATKTCPLHIRNSNFSRLLLPDAKYTLPDNSISIILHKFDAHYLYTCLLKSAPFPCLTRAREFYRKRYTWDTQLSIANGSN